MPTTRSRGLSTADLDSLRTQVEAGRKPKVVFTAAAGQIAGQTGQIVRFGDPATDEWVVVRFGRDELPFAPGDLQLPPPKPARTKASAPKAGASKAASTATSTGSAPMTSAAPVAAATATSTGNRPVTAPTAATPPAATPSGGAAASRTIEPAKGVARTAEPARSGAAVRAAELTPGAPAKPAEATEAAAATKPRPARKPGGKGKSPEITVSLAHHDGQWTVSASKGARVLIKPAPVRAADALKMVNMLDSPAVAEIVDEIVAAARQEAEDHAARLRRELAEVEAALADLSDEE